jgi:hypothetical protein
VLILIRSHKLFETFSIYYLNHSEYNNICSKLSNISNLIIEIIGYTMRLENAEYTRLKSIFSEPSSFEYDWEDEAVTALEQYLKYYQMKNGLGIIEFFLFYT